MLKTERKAKTCSLIMADDSSLFSELKEIDNNEKIKNKRKKKKLQIVLEFQKKL